MVINPKQATTEIAPSENTTDGWRALLEMFECANAQFKESTALSQLTKETVERVLKTADLMQRTRPHKKITICPTSTGTLVIIDAYYGEPRSRTSTPQPSTHHVIKEGEVIDSYQTYSYRYQPPQDKLKANDESTNR